MNGLAIALLDMKPSGWLVGEVDHALGGSWGGKCQVAARNKLEGAGWLFDDSLLFRFSLSV